MTERQRCTGRGYRAAHCMGCGLRCELCLCSELEPHSSAASVTFVMHWRERSKPTNTVRLAERLLTNCRVVERGREKETAGAVATALAQLEPAKCLLLFPSESAVPLSSVPRQRGAQLIVPDGTWAQARRWIRREPALAGMRHVALPQTSVRSYALRRSAAHHLLSSFEATALALGHLEGPELTERLLGAFARWQERSLRSRDGGLRVRSVSGPGGVDSEGPARAGS